jgi:hypothetical protein
MPDFPEYAPECADQAQVFRRKAERLRRFAAQGLEPVLDLLERAQDFEKRAHEIELHAGLNQP